MFLNKIVMKKNNQYINFYQKKCIKQNFQIELVKIKQSLLIFYFL